MLKYNRTPSMSGVNAKIFESFLPFFDDNSESFLYMEDRNIINFLNHFIRKYNNQIKSKAKRKHSKKRSSKGKKNTQLPQLPEITDPKEEKKNLASSQRRKSVFGHKNMLHPSLSLSDNPQRTEAQLLSGAASMTEEQSEEDPLQRAKAWLIEHINQVILPSFLFYHGLSVLPLMLPINAKRPPINASLKAKLGNQSNQDLKFSFMLNGQVSIFKLKERTGQPNLQAKKGAEDGKPKNTYTISDTLAMRNKSRSKLKSEKHKLWRKEGVAAAQRKTTLKKQVSNPDSDKDSGIEIDVKSENDDPAEQDDLHKEIQHHSRGIGKSFVLEMSKEITFFLSSESLLPLVSFVAAIAAESKTTPEQRTTHNPQESKKNNSYKTAHRPSKLILNTPSETLNNPQDIKSSESSLPRSKSQILEPDTTINLSEYQEIHRFVHTEEKMSIRERYSPTTHQFNLLLARTRPFYSVYIRSIKVVYIDSIGLLTKRVEYLDPSDQTKTMVPRRLEFCIGDIYSTTNLARKLEGISFLNSLIRTLLTILP